jgi:hypothetical protein
MILRALLVCATVLAASGIARAQTTWFVDDDAVSGGAGTSWSTAFDDFQLAIDAAVPGDQIWVAEGTYRPSVPTDPPDPRSASFVLPHDVAIYGGFLGHEASVAERAGSFRATVLDGDIGSPASSDDNSYHVVRLIGTDHFVFTRLDGFDICHGVAVAGAGGPMRGGGVAVSLNGQYGPALTLANCTVHDNVADQGGGLATVNLSRINLERCEVYRNGALQKGGGLYAITALVTSLNTRWHHNVALGEGGAFFTISTNVDWLVFANNVFHDNSADRGGALAIGGGQFVHGGATLELCTLAYNSANEGGACFVQTAATQKGHLKLENSIVWANAAATAPQITAPVATISVQFTDVQGGYAGAGNLDVDPLFEHPLSRDLHPAPGSPVHDAGDSQLVMGDPFDLDRDGILNEMLPLDLADLRRAQDDPYVPNTGAGLGGLAPVDLGAFEN